MAIELRPYQAEAKDAILQEWSEGRKRTLLVLPTGCGKTVVLAKVAEDQVDHGGRVLIMAHRPAAIQECDMLLVLEGGMRKAFGPRDEVLRETVRNHTNILRNAGPGGVS